MKVQSGSLYGEKFQFHPFWRLTRWGLGFSVFNRGSDEWGNPSVFLILPLLGEVVYFTGNVDRSGWFLSGSISGELLYISPDYAEEAYLPLFEEAPTHYDPFEWLHEHRQTLTDDYIREHATRIEPLNLQYKEAP